MDRMRLLEVEGDVFVLESVVLVALLPVRDTATINGLANVHNL